MTQRKIAPKPAKGKGPAQDVPENRQALLKNCLMDYLTEPGRSAVPVHRDDLREILSFVEDSDLVNRERFDTITREAAKCLIYQAKVQGAVKCLRGVRLILDEVDGGTAGQASAALISLVIDSLDRTDVALVGWVEKEGGQGK